MKKSDHKRPDYAIIITIINLKTRLELKTERQLYGNFKPEHYRLHFRYNDDRQTFAGHIVISGKKIGRPSRRLTFHQKGLRILNAKITRHDKNGDTVFELARINHHRSFEQVRLHSKHLLYPGTYKIVLNFFGKITATTRPTLEKTNLSESLKKLLGSGRAREIFPCIDEPEGQAKIMIINYEQI